MSSRKPDLSNLAYMAKEVNTIPLPNIPDNPHILLPPQEHSLTRVNFQIFSEELYNNLNNPHLDLDSNKNLEESELNTLKNKGKSRQSIIGIKRHTDRLSINSNFKKRRYDFEESSITNTNNNGREKYSNDIQIKQTKNTLITNPNNLSYGSNNNFNNISGYANPNVSYESLIKKNNLIHIDDYNIKASSSSQNNFKNISEINEEDKSDNQDILNDEYNGEDNDADDYEQNQSDNNNEDFDLRGDFHSDMGDLY